MLLWEKKKKEEEEEEGVGIGLFVVDVASIKS